jgi:predicted flavoprotein YhiN
LHSDLKPALNAAQIAAKLVQKRPGDTIASALRKALGLSPLAINLLREANGAPLSNDPTQLAAFIKAVPLRLKAPRGLNRAISTAGGVAWNAVDDGLQLRAIPGTYVVGEMLDWEAPTGGYLLQGCFASGVWAARAILQQASGLEAPRSR